MNDFLKFFTRRLEGVIRYKEHIKRINIYVRKDLTFGKQYFRVYFDVKFIEDIDKLSFEKRQLLVHYFHNNASVSGSGFVSYLEYDFNTRDKQLQRLKKFSSLYNICTTHASMLFNNLLDKSVSVQISTLDIFPEINLANKFYNDISSRKEYEYLYNSKFYNDATQFNYILKLSLKWLDYFEKYKDIKTITDQEIASSCYCRLSDVRSVLIDKEINVPFKLTIKEKVIALVDFDLFNLKSKVLGFNNEMKKRLQWYNINNHVLEHALNEKINELELIDKEKNKIELFLNEFPIKIKDIVITNNSIFFVNSSSIENNKLILSCLNMKLNSLIGKRKNTIELKEVSKYLDRSDFEKLKVKYTWKYNYQVKKWIMKNGNKDHLKYLKRKKIFT